MPKNAQFQRSAPDLTVDRRDRIARNERATAEGAERIALVRDLRAEHFAAQRAEFDRIATKVAEEIARSKRTNWKPTAQACADAMQRNERNSYAIGQSREASKTETNERRSADIGRNVKREFGDSRLNRTSAKGSDDSQAGVKVTAAIATSDRLAGEREHERRAIEREIDDLTRSIAFATGKAKEAIRNRRRAARHKLANF